MAATNRNLESEMLNGNFRRDFYYRLCADRIETPGLSTMLSQKGRELEILVGFIAEKLAGPEEREQLTNEVLEWIRQSMSKGYTWPGNFRELEQCVRNVMVHGEYRPPCSKADLIEKEDGGARTPTLNQLIQQLVNREYSKTPNLAQVADRLQVDRRTIKRYLNLPS